jgi:hypothetical protein
MPEYRAYTVGDDDHFIDSTLMVCVDDVDAINRAKRFARGKTIEIWRANRLVKRLNRDENKN